MELFCSVKCYELNRQSLKYSPPSIHSDTLLLWCAYDHYCITVVCFIWVQILVSHIKDRARIDNITEQNADNHLWI
jgi:hypothetical protein